MKGLKRFFKRFEDEMVATAFAEAGEFETAREILAESEHMLKEDKKGTVICEDKSKEVISTPVKL